MKIKSIALMLITAAGIGQSVGQDIHFSQYYASPLTLNPALTGSFNGLYRITGIYRNQWSGFTNVKPFFSTPSGSVDFSLLKDKLKNDALGVGLVFVNDQAMEKKFTTNMIAATVAYHKGLDKLGKHQIGLGFQGGYVMQRIDPNFTFGDQYDNAGQPVNPTAEVIESNKQNYFDLNMGAFVKTQPLDWLTFYAGYSWFHITKPKIQFIATTAENRLPYRHVIHGGFEFSLKKRFLLIPGVLFQTMAKTNETNFGLTFGYHFIQKPNATGTVFLGLWHRVGRDVIPKFGIEYKNIRVSAAYDLGVGQIRKDSKNAAVGRTPQAFEISLSYIGSIFVPRENNYLFNPRF